MIGGEQKQPQAENQQNLNPEKHMDVEPSLLEIPSMAMENHSFHSFRDLDKEVQEIINPFGSNYVEGENDMNPVIIWQEQSRPSPPIDDSQSQSQSNQKESKSKPVPLSNELIRLTKKSTTTVSKQKQRKERQRKVRCFITKFDPYLPQFLDELHRDHYKNMIRIGQNYQAKVKAQPQFESIHRPMGHLRIWEGSEEKMSKQALKKFRQIYGENRTEEQLILLKHRVQSESWNELMREMSANQLPGKKSSLVIASNSLGVITTRNK